MRPIQSAPSSTQAERPRRGQTADLHPDDRNETRQESSQNETWQNRSEPTVLGLVAAPGSRLRNAEVRQQLFLELVLAIDSDQLVDFLAVLEEHDGRNRRDSQATRSLLFSSVFILPTLTLPS